MVSRLLWVMFVLAIAALVAAGWGGDDKPAYWGIAADLQVSVDDVKNVELSESGALSTLQTELRRSGATQTLCEFGEGGFPDETSALKSSVSKLSTTIDQLPSYPRSSRSSARAGGQQCGAAARTSPAPQARPATDRAGPGAAQEPKTEGRTNG